MKSKSLIVFLVLCSVLDYSYGQRDKIFFRNDYSFIEASQSFYKIHTLPNTWWEAKGLCALEGARLFYPENEHEAQTVISFWKSSQPSSWVFVGISDLLVEGIFVTMDGTRVSDVYNHWGRGEPSNVNIDEHCVLMHVDGFLNDVKCSRKFPFICKKSLDSLEWNQACNMSNLDYTFNEQFGRCYKVHTKPLKWSEAYTVCSAEQSYLAVIDTQEEADFLVAYTKAAPKHRVKGNDTCDSVHLGFHNRLGEGWHTVKGIPFDDNSRVTWGNNQPDGGEQAQCGSMLYNGDLNDISCDTRCFFICEHEVKLQSLMLGQLGNTTTL